MALIPEVKNHYGRLKLFINGRWVDSSSGNIRMDTNPATDEVIAEVPMVTSEEAKAAVEAAYRAFGSWKEVPLRDRARYLFDLRERFERHFDALSRVLSQDHGRTIEEARGSVRRCIENIESACSSLYLVTKGEHVDQLASGLDEYLLWEPVGVFLIVTPGNIPMHAWSSFVPYALAAGCTVVVSPSRQDPVCPDLVFKVAQEAGFPDGVLNLIHGGREINLEILSQPEVKGMGFIGSTATGRIFFEEVAKLGKRASINGNGKNYIVVMPDADMDQGVGYLLRACYGMSGQRCLGMDNVVVVGDRYRHLKESFLEASRRLRLGYGLDEETKLGPMTTREGKKKVIEFIERGISEGAKLLLDGRGARAEGYPRGYFVGPTIFEEVDPEMKIAKEEAFGPVANLIRASSLDQAIEWINTKTDFGHSACILTSNNKYARRFIREVNVGNVGVNVGIPQPYAFFPLGSKRSSSMGVSKSRIDSMRLFMDQKTVTVRWA